MIFWALPLFWLACATAGYVYALQRGIPSSVVLAALPAFLLEATLFLTLGVEGWRKRLEKLRPAGVAAATGFGCGRALLRGVVAFGSFRWQSLAGIALLAGLVSFWYVVLPQKPAADLLLLALMAAVVLTKVFEIAVHPARPPAAARSSGAGHVDPDWRLRAAERPPRARGRLRILAVASRVENRRCVLPDHAAGGGRAGLVDRIRQIPSARDVLDQDPSDHGAVFLRRIMGSGAGRGVLLPRAAPAVDDRMAAQPMGRSDRDFVTVRRRPPVVQIVSQLAFRAAGSGGRRILRPGFPPSQQYPRFDGDPRAHRSPPCASSSLKYIRIWSEACCAKLWAGSHRRWSIWPETKCWRNSVNPWVRRRL